MSDRATEMETCASCSNDTPKGTVLCEACAIDEERKALLNERDALRTEVEHLYEKREISDLVVSKLVRELREAREALRKVSKWCHQSHGGFPQGQCGLCMPLLAVLAKVTK